MKGGGLALLLQAPTRARAHPHMTSGMRDTPGSTWWRDYFDARYLEIYRDRLPPEQTRAEVGAIIDLLGLPLGARILDVPCGWGRHSLLLAEAGYSVTGVDLSPLQVQEAEHVARRMGVEVEWVQRDMRELAWSARFDAALSLFTSLGYWVTDEDDLAVLRGIRTALRPGGVFLLETMHRDALVRRYAPRDWYETEDGTVVRVEREFDAVEGVSREWLWWQRGEEKGEKFHQVRIRTATEWERLLREADLVPEGWYGGWQMKPFTRESPRLLVLARRQI